MDIGNNNVNDLNLNELNAEIMRLRGEIDAKMDNYFISENKDIYNSMLKYDLKREGGLKFKS